VTSAINRYYDPTTDQFLSVDPDVATTDQPYVFTNDDPLNGADPLGEHQVSLLGGFAPTDSNACEGSGGPTELQMVGCEDYTITGTPYAPTNSGTTQFNNAAIVFSTIFGLPDDLGLLAAGDESITASEGYEIDEGATDHMFRDVPNHVPDTAENRELITETANDPKNYEYTEPSGAKIYRENLKDGTQVWAKVYDGRITNGGINSVPK
jgi:hypothetical protein